MTGNEFSVFLFSQMDLISYEECMLITGSNRYKDKGHAKINI